MKRFVRWAAVLALLLPGCLNYEQHTVISEDGSGTLSIHYSIAENVLSWMSDGNLSFTEDKVREQYSGEGVNIESLSISTEASDSSRHVHAELEFDDIEKLSKLRGFKGMEFRWLREGDQFRLTHKLGATNSSGDASLDAFMVRYSYEFPGDIIESNADSTYGRTAYWMFRLSELNADHVITASISATAGSSTTYVLVVIGVVMLLIAIFALRRRGKS
jgi:LPXTG-motif cell wall-anchored protein